MKLYCALLLIMCANNCVASEGMAELRKGKEQRLATLRKLSINPAAAYEGAYQGDMKAEVDYYKQLHDYESQEQDDSMEPDHDSFPEESQDQGSVWAKVLSFFCIETPRSQ